jgi:hypothetical protein
LALAAAFRTCERLAFALRCRHDFQPVWPDVLVPLLLALGGMLGLGGILQEPEAGDEMIRASSVGLAFA